MKMLVTGGLGFIGMNFINYWLEHYDDQVVNLDKMTYASNNPDFILNESKENYSFIKGDICDTKLVKEIVTDVDCIVNFAAESHVDNSIDSSRKFVETNVLGTHNLLEAARKFDVRFHHISTDEVFGALEPGSDNRFDENTCYDPQNPYSATKASADHLVNAYVNTYGVRATISNCSNNFGPLQHPEKLIPKSILRLLDRKKVELYGDGMQIRDWIFVTDHCSAIDTILKRGKIGESYLIGAENEKTNTDIVHSIAEILQINSENSIEFITDRLGHDRRYAIDPSKIMKELGWTPKFNFAGALRETVEFYKANYDLFSGNRVQ